MSDPFDFIPDRATVGSTATRENPYELAWRLSHSNLSLSEAIDSLAFRLGVRYNVASALVWAEMSSPAVRLPGN